MSADLTTLSLTQISSGLAEKKFTSRAVLSAHLDRIRAHDGSVKAFLALDEADALRRADASDARRADGKPLGPLDGVPIAIKDNIAVRGQRLSGASKILENFVSPYDATVIEKLAAAGAVVYGRLNMDEFAMGSSTENSAYAKTTNPWDTSRIPGGSSGGSAAAVAAGFAPAALGSDTGGSIRQPAGHCGVVGLKPTYGRVSRYGLAAYASSLDQIGPIARTVEDCALLLETLAGRDAHDGTSLANPVDGYAAAARAKTLPKVIGLPGEYFGDGIDPVVRETILAAADWYRAQGCEIRHISLKNAGANAIPVYYILATAEASSNLSRYDGIRYTRRAKDATDPLAVYAKSRGEFFGPEVKRRIILGTYVLSAGFYDAYYTRAQKVRTLIRDEFLAAFASGVDMILSPTTPTPAYKLGAKKDDPLAEYLGDLYTISANLAGLPAITLPCGFADAGDGSGKKLPVGLQLIGQPLGESALLGAAAAFEAAHPFAGQLAPL